MYSLNVENKLYQERSTKFTSDYETVQPCQRREEPDLQICICDPTHPISLQSKRKPRSKLIKRHMKDSTTFSLSSSSSIQSCETEKEDEEREKQISMISPGGESSMGSSFFPSDFPSLKLAFGVLVQKYGTILFTTTRGNRCVVCKRPSFSFFFFISF